MHWFIKRGRKSALLSAIPAMTLAFVLLNATGLTQSAEQAENSDNSKDYEEVFFSAIDTNYPGVIYIDWSAPKATNAFSCAAWFLGAYRSVRECGLPRGVRVNPARPNKGATQPKRFSRL